MRILKGPVNQIVTIAGKAMLSSMHGIMIATNEEAEKLRPHGFNELATHRASVDPENRPAEHGQIWHNTVTDKLFLRFADKWHETKYADALVKLAAPTPTPCPAPVPTAAPSPTPAPTPDPNEDDLCLLGSSVQPSIFTLQDGTEVQLGTVVQEAFKRSGLKTAKEWNTRAEPLNEKAIAAVVAELPLKKAAPVDHQAGV